VATLTRPDAGAACRWRREASGHALRCVQLEPDAQQVFTTKQLQLRDRDVGTGAARCPPSDGQAALRSALLKKLQRALEDLVTA
jgi:hypothetical protein